MITSKEKLMEVMIRMNEDHWALIQSVDISEELKSKIMAKYLSASAALYEAWDYCHPGEKD